MKYNISATECRELSRNFEDLPIRELSNALVYVGAKKKKKRFSRLLYNRAFHIVLKVFKKKKEKLKLHYNLIRETKFSKHYFAATIF